MELVIAFALIGMAASFYGGYTYGRRVERESVDVPLPSASTVYVPLPFPITPERPLAPPFSVELDDMGVVTVPRRTQRIFAHGKAWDHYGTTSAGVWLYRPVDADTPRQAQQKAWAQH